MQLKNRNHFAPTATLPFGSRVSLLQGDGHTSVKTDVIHTSPSVQYNAKVRTVPNPEQTKQSYGLRKESWSMLSGAKYFVDVWTMWIPPLFCMNGIVLTT